MAKTGNEWTTYSIQVPHSGFLESLKGLSSVFTLPQISSEDVWREVLSVDAEFQHMKLDDRHRFSHLNLYLSRPDARCTRFFEGDYQSLAARFLGNDLSDHSQRAPEDDETCGWAILKKKVLGWWNENYPGSLKSISLVGRGALPCLASAETLERSSCFANRVPRRAVSDGCSMLF